MWDKALNAARVPMDSILRQPGSIYYHLHIRVFLDAFPPSTAIAPDTFEQPLAIQIALPPPEVSKGASQTGDQNQGVEGDKDKDKGKEKLPSLEAKSAAEDDAAKTKEVKAQTKKANPKAKDAATSQPSHKEDPSAPKSRTQHLGFLLQFVCFFVFFFFFFSFFLFLCRGTLLLDIMYSTLFNENALLFIPCSFALDALKVIIIIYSIELLSLHPKKRDNNNMLLII